MKHRALFLLPILVLALPCLAAAQKPKATAKPCDVRGVWELVSGTWDGQPMPAGLHQRKIITRSHIAWVREDDNVPKEVKTAADSLALALGRVGATGTYTVHGSTYTETIESFPDPGYQGMSVPFTCRVEGDRFYQSGNLPILENGKKVRDMKLEEVYRRVE